MRAYLKLMAIVLVAAGVQWVIRRDINWIEDAAFTMRIAVATCLGRPIPADQLCDEAQAMITRQVHRSHPGAMTPAEQYEARRAAGEFADPADADSEDEVVDVAASEHAVAKLEL